MTAKTAARAAAPKAAAQMQLSPAGATFLRIEEGFIDHWYADPTGTGTIGVGFTWLSDSFREWWGKNRPEETFGKGAKMTRADADDCLRFMVAREYGAAVNKALGAVAQHVFDGAVSPVFNLGTGALKWKWALALKRGDVTEAARLLRETGLTSKGVKLQGLVNRRKEEVELIALGDYTIGKVAADPLDDGMLVRGERGAPVIELQKALADGGFYAGVIDGKFGYGTEAAVLAFQREHGLKDDGWAGPKTLAALGLAGSADELAPEGPVQGRSAPDEQTPTSTPPRPSAPGWLRGAGIVAFSLLVGATVWFIQHQGAPAEPEFLIPHPRPFGLISQETWVTIALSLAMPFIGPIAAAAATWVVAQVSFWWARWFKTEFDAKSAADLQGALVRGILLLAEGAFANGKLKVNAAGGRQRLLDGAAEYAAKFQKSKVRHFKLSHEDLMVLAAPHLTALEAGLQPVLPRAAKAAK